MVKWISKRKRVTQHQWYSEYRPINPKFGQRGCFFAFDCDEYGNVTVTEGNKANYEYCISHPEEFRHELYKHEWDYMEPAVIECEFCGNHVTLESTWANECECGVEYNICGQALADRRFWGEETGETLSDMVLDYDPEEIR